MCCRLLYIFIPRVSSLLFTCLIKTVITYILLTINFFNRTKGKTLEQMDTIFGDQLVPHALEGQDAADAAMKLFHEKHAATTDQEEHAEETQTQPKA